MSYTTLDWLSDMATDQDFPRDYRPHRGCVNAIIALAREDRMMMVRMDEYGDLVIWARQHGLPDPSDDASWEGDDDVRDGAMLAVLRWEKEHMEWEKD